MKCLLFIYILIFSQNSTPNSPAPILNEYNATETVRFTLQNKSLKSIPLIIPGVMNPNLSPNSKSGVTLKVGQKVLFKYRGKRRILLIVNRELEGQTINVANLLKIEKKKIDDY